LKRGSTITHLKQENKNNELLSPDEHAPKKVKVEKIMATVFWDANGISLIDYLEKGKTITRECYASLTYWVN